MAEIAGEVGNDTLFGTPEADTLAAGDGDDTLFAYAGDDELAGESGNDVLYAGKGNDFLVGGNYNDVLHGDFGVDTLTGGIGRDKFVIDRRESYSFEVTNADYITDFEDGLDAIVLARGVKLDDISLSQGSGDLGGDTIIRDSVTGDYLAIVKGVNVSAFDSTDFIEAVDGSDLLLPFPAPLVEVA